MLQLLLDDPILLLMLLPVLLLSLTVHEVSHGYAAYKCGDSTAHDLGRLSLNPLVHLDITGTIAMLVIGFGWAKPVPVNFRNLKKPKRDIAIVSAAGPLSNLLICLVSTLLYFLCLGLFASRLDPALPGAITDMISSGEFQFNIMMYDQSGLFGTMPELQTTVLQLFSLSALVNAGLAVFNLIPFPPLDGSKILACLLPNRLSYRFLALERYARYVVVGICLLSVAGNYIPFLSGVGDILLFPVSYLRGLLLDLFSLLARLIFLR